MGRRRRMKEDLGGRGGEMSTNKEKPQQRNAANARERARMRVLSRAFCRLKTTLPWVPADTKLSKLDTLRLASSYISHLKAILKDGSGDQAQLQDTPLLHPAITLTWPFGFNRGSGGTGSGGGGSDSDGESGSECSWDEMPGIGDGMCVHLGSSPSSRQIFHPHPAEPNPSFEHHQFPHTHVFT